MKIITKKPQRKPHVREVPFNSTNCTGYACDDLVLSGKDITRLAVYAERDPTQLRAMVLQLAARLKRNRAPLHTGGPVMGRLSNRDPEMQDTYPYQRRAVEAAMCPNTRAVRFAELRQKLPTGPGAKIIVESTPGAAVLNADFSEIEKRVMAQMGIDPDKMGEDNK